MSAQDGLRDRADKGGTPLLEKLAALSDDEWTELTHRMQKHFGRELANRSMVLASPEKLADALEAEFGWILPTADANDWFLAATSVLRRMS